VVHVYCRNYTVVNWLRMLLKCTLLWVQTANEWTHYTWHDKCDCFIVKSIIEYKNIWKLIKKRTLEKNFWWLRAWPSAPFLTSASICCRIWPNISNFGLENRQRVFSLQVSNWRVLMKRGTSLFLQRGRIAGNAKRCNTYSNSFCPSVCPSVCLSDTRWYAIQTNELRITRSLLWGSKNTLVFCYQQWLRGDIPFHLKFALKVTHPSEKRRLLPISAYNISTVRASEKSSTITNRKSATRFPTSYRWSPYVTPKSRKGWLKKQICHFCE